jgi:UPF0755 protein
MGLPFLFVVFLGGYTVFSVDSTEVWTEKPVLVPEGTTLDQAAELLNREGIVEHKRFFWLLGKFTQSDRKIHAGEYILNTDMSSWEVLSLLREGKIVRHRVVVREGATLAEIGKTLERERLVDLPVFEQSVRDPNFIESLDLKGDSLEGYLYPDTYFFFKGQTVENILRTMVARFQENYTPEMAGRAREMGMTTQEIVTLASIIEKEAVVSSDRPLISAVFHNRLRKGIPLQSDPTVIYALGDQFDGDLKRVHLRYDSPFNTYIQRGLPPGPIGSPGLASLRAALYPADVDYYYFVSRNDGTHYFSRTIRDHNKAVEKYQKPRKS